MKIRKSLLCILFLALFAGSCFTPAECKLPPEAHKKAVANYKAKVDVKLKVDLTDIKQSGPTAVFTVKEIEQIPDSASIKVGDKILMKYRGGNYRYYKGYTGSNLVPYTGYLPGPLLLVVNGKTAKNLSLEAINEENLIKSENGWIIEAHHMYPPPDAVIDYLKTTGKNKPTVWSHARKLNKEKKFDEALEAWTKVIKSFPKSGRAYTGKATALYNLERKDDAIAALNKAIKVERRYTGSYKLLAEIYDKMGQPDKAAETRKMGKAAKYKEGSIFK